MLRFVDRTALSDYLMGKYDTSWGQDTASPLSWRTTSLWTAGVQTRIEEAPRSTKDCALLPI